MPTAKILLVDDDNDILEFLSYNLKREGFDIEIATSGSEAIKLARDTHFDIIILDVMMPQMDGIEACAKIRESEKNSSSMIVFLTARGEDYSQLAGFQAGADDYITKPISPKVFVSKITALLRRNKSDSKEQKVNDSSDFTIDREKYVLYKKGKEISLPKKEFELATLLISHPGRVFGREAILNSIWGEDVVVGDRTIDVHVRKIREKLGKGYFKTIKGVGYKYVPK